MEELIKSFLTIGYGSGNGDGSGDGDGDGYGDGYGYGNGNGYGNGDGDGYGNGYGNGYGYGSGDGDGSGSGNGDGSGDGDGYGYGDGYGNGYGYGDGDGYGDGYGSGYGNGFLSSLKKVGNDNIYDIDGVPTAIDNIKGNIAKCRILRVDMTWEPCYVVRIGNSFAHGETLHDAHRDATQKHMSNAPEEERLRLFVEQFPDPDAKIAAAHLFDWHNILTGSCMMGRKQWCHDHGINVKTDTFTVKEFIRLTKNSFGGNTITKLIDLYK